MSEAEVATNGVGGAFVVGAAAPPRKGPAVDQDEIFARFTHAAEELLRRLRQRDDEFLQVMRITERINYGVMLEEVLEFVYREIRQVIPYNRIGFSLLDEPRGEVVARWAHSDREMLLATGYRGPLAGSTLQRILETGRPRIINNLQDYLRRKPESKPTQMIVQEGMRSSLTCPLLVQGKPVGFLFFSSDQPNAYANAHVAFFQQIAGQLAAIVEKGRLYTELAEQKAIIERQNQIILRDLDMARQVQRALIPSQAIEVPGLEIALEYRPAIQIGGDAIDVVPLDHGGLLFIADATGHGVRAALVMSVMKAALRSAVQADPSPAAVLRNLNRCITGLFGNQEQFVTAACCRIDGLTRRAELSLAGHPPPVWVNRQGEVVNRTFDSGLPLGVENDYLYESSTLELAAGDALLFFTDGVFEARDPQGEPFGMQRLEALCARHAHRKPAELLSAIMADLQSHQTDRPFDDDCALLAAKAL